MVPISLGDAVFSSQTVLEILPIGILARIRY